MTKNAWIREMTPEEAAFENSDIGRVWPRELTWVVAIVAGLALWAVIIASVSAAYAGSDIYGAIQAQFSHEPTKPFVVLKVPSLRHPALVNCGRPSSGGTVVSCIAFTVPKRDKCYAFIWRGLTRTQYALAVRHEKANCNGWNDGFAR